MTEILSNLAESEAKPPGHRPGEESPYSIGNSPSLAVAPPTDADAGDEIIPQPGLAAGLLTTACFPLSQFFIAIPVLIFISMFVADGDKAGRLTAMLAGSQGGVLLVAVFAGAACAWLAKHKMFSLAPVRVLHLFALVGLVLPATMLSRACYDVAFAGWSQLTAAMPGLKFMDEMNTMAQIEEIVSNVPFGVMLFGMAVVPALAEEIIFRGIIGRGLKARYGLISGIVMTSILFGMAHMHPAHAVSVIPLGIVMHVLYVATRSFWAPVLFHFCNNAFAVVGATVAMKQGQAVTIEEAPVLPWWIALAGLISVAAWFYLLSVTRTRLLKQDGTDWDPGYESTETPRHIATHRHYPEMPLAPTIAAILGGGLFFASLMAFGAMNLEQANPEALILLFR